MLLLSCLSVRKKGLPAGDRGERLESVEELSSLSEPGWLCSGLASGFGLTTVCSVHASVGRQGNGNLTLIGLQAQVVTTQVGKIASG